MAGGKTLGVVCLFLAMAPLAEASKPNEAPVAVLVNQVGYEPSAPKVLVLHVRDGAENAPNAFTLVDESGEVVYRGELVPHGRIHGESPSDWGARYWTGDFTAFQEEGTFKAQALGVSSFPFRIEKNVIFRRTAAPAAGFYHWQRCGYAMPGLHQACHLDDARIPEELGGGHIDATGGWHDAGDYNKYNGFTPHSVYALSLLGRKPTQFLTRAQRSQILNEAAWGADFIWKMWQPGKGIMYRDVHSGYGKLFTPESETDGIKGNEDDRPIRGQGPNPMAAAALAALAAESGRQKYRKAAEDLWRGAVAALDKSEMHLVCPPAGDLWRGAVTRSERDEPRLVYPASVCVVQYTAELLLADLELERLTGGRRYREGARQRVELLLKQQGPDGLWPPNIVAHGLPPAALALYLEKHPTDPASRKVRSALKAWLERSLELSANPFRITPWSDGVFFYPYRDAKAWRVGQNSQYLSQAWALYLAGRLLGDARAKALADRQVDWVLGANPYAVCMLEGKGSFNFPTYHHSYNRIPSRNIPGVSGWESGAIPGAVPNGLARPAYNLDKPWGDFVGRDYTTTEPWLPHNAFYILAVLENVN